MQAPRWIAAATLAMALSIPATASADSSLYVSGYSSAEVAVLDIGADGKVTLRPGGTIPTQDGPTAIAMTPDGRYLFTSNSLEASIGRYAVGPDRGLSLLGDITLPADPYGIAVTPDGRFLYVVLSSTDEIAGYAIGPDGSLTPVPGSPLDVTAADNVAVSPDGRTLYSIHGGGPDALRAFRIGSDGSLGQLPGSPLDGGQGTYEISVTPDGRFLYGSDYTSNVVHGWSLAADGTPTALPDFALPNGPYAGLVPSPDSRHLYVTAYDTGAIHSLAIAADGSLTQVGLLPLIDEATSAAITPDGRFVYTTAFTDPAQIYEFSVGADGALAQLAGTPVDSGVVESDIESMTITPNQGPVAEFRMKLNGKRAKLNASGSSDSNGTVVSYAWDFGDGNSETTTEPNTTHRFRGKPGEVTLTVTDNEGCAATRVYTGQDTLCNSGDAATFVNAGVAGAQIKAKRDQRQEETVNVAVRARAKEAATAVAKGKVALSGGKRAVALKRVRAKLKPGRPKILKLRPKVRAAAGRIAAHLAAGGKAKARLSVTLKDSDGNRVRVRPAVRLTG